MRSRGVGAASDLGMTVVCVLVLLLCAIAFGCHVAQAALQDPLDIAFDDDPDFPHLTFDA